MLYLMHSYDDSLNDKLSKHSAADAWASFYYNIQSV